MNSDPTSPPQQTLPGGSERRAAGHDSSAFVVRFWEEPREGDGAPVLRGYVKHLKTGREQYFSDLSEVPRLLGTEVGERRRSRPLMSGPIATD